MSQDHKISFRKICTFRRVHHYAFLHEFDNRTFLKIFYDNVHIQTFLELFFEKFLLCELQNDSFQIDVSSKPIWTQIFQNIVDSKKLCQK